MRLTFDGPESLFKRYILAVSLIASLVTVSHFADEWATSAQKDDAPSINMSGRQRMLSQRIQLYSERFADFSADHEQHKLLLERAVSEFSSAHLTLTGVDENGNRTKLPTELEAHYFGSNDSSGDNQAALDDAVQQFIVLATNVLTSNEGNVQDALGALSDFDSERLLVDLNKAVLLRVDLAESRHSLAHNISRLGFGLALAVLLFEILFIFRPSHRMVQRAIKNLEESNESLNEAQEGLKKLSSSLDLMNDEIYLLDPETLRCTFMNRKARQRLPEGVVDYSKLTATDVFPNFSETHYREVILGLESRDSKSLVLEHSVPGIEHGELAIQILEIEEHEPLIMNQFRDISWRVEFESEIARLEAAIESSDDIIMIADPKFFGVVYANQTARESSNNFKVSESENGSLKRWFHESEQDAFEKSVDELKNENEKSVLFETTDINGTDVEVKLQLVSASGGEWLVAILRDITARKELERNKKQFVSVVSHELRTPITSIKGALAVLAAGVLEANPKGATDLAKIADTNADKLTRLVNDIVDMEKIESGKFQVVLEPTNLADCVRESIAQNTEYANQFEVSLVAKEIEETANIQGDSLRLTQILDNLISNAIKFSAGSKEVHIYCTKKSGQCKMVVEDFGDGISEENKTKIFEAFEQIGRSKTGNVKGSGLGLSIVKELVNKHHGEITVESEIGKGTKFVVTFPELIEESNVA